MKKPIISIAALSVFINFALAQPGYLGSKHVVETNITASPSYIIREYDGSKNQWNYGVRFEKVSSTKASWVFGLSFGSSLIDSIAMNDYGSVMPLNYYNSSSGWNEHIYPAGEVKYSYQELSIQRRWYFGSMGSIAPYGIYFGLQSDLARMKQSTGDLPFYSQYSEKLITFEPEVSRTHTAFSESMVIGNRRMIQRNFAIGFNMSLGYVFFQSSRPALANTGALITNHMDVQENIMVRHFAMRKVIQLGLNLGYLF